MQSTSMANFRFTFLIGMMIWAVAGVAQTTVINGKAPDYAGMQVLVYAEADPLSQKQELLQETETDAEGVFRLELDLPETQPIRISINHVSGYLVVQKSATYDIFFPELQDDQVRSFSGTTYTELIFTDPPADDINVVLGDINFAVDSMLMANVSLVGSRYFQPKLLEFETEMENRFGDSDDKYILQHLKYTLAITEFSTRSYTRHDLYKRHLADGSWHMHPTFFAFVRSYFQQYFKRFEANYGSDLIQPALKKEVPGAELLGLMQKDNLLKNDTLRELVAIHALMESFHSDYSRRQIVASLRYISVSGTTDFVRNSAENAIDVLTATAVGFDAPEISFFNQHNERVSLDQFHGKHVYLEFISTWCSECKREQTILPDLRKEYGDVVEIVTVVVDSPREDFQRYLAAHPHYDWNILFDDSGYKSIDRYRVHSLPYYYLIDPDGKLAMSPAPSPTDGVVEQLYPILQKAQEQKRFKVGE